MSPGKSKKLNELKENDELKIGMKMGNNMMRMIIFLVKHIFNSIKMINVVSQ